VATTPSKTLREAFTMKQHTIHLLLDNIALQGGQPFHQGMARDAQTWVEQADKSSDTFQLDVLESKGNRDKQKEQVDQLGTQLPPDSEDFVGISPTATGFVEFYLRSLFALDADAAREKLTVCIFLEPLSPSAVQRYGQRRLFSATPSQELMGRMQGEVIHRVHPAPGNVLYMVGPSRSYPTRFRLRGAREFLEPKGYNILAMIESNWEGVGAEEAVVGWEGKIEKVDAAIAQNDSMAAGMRAGLVRRGGGHIPVVGLDGTPFGRALVDAGKLVATVIQPNGVSAALRTYRQLLTGAQGVSDLPADRDIQSQPACYPPLDTLTARSGG
jgi:ABC-type sugar transport system substrate-binding protein